MSDVDLLSPTGWTALLLGLFLVSAASGALRNPGVWQTMVREFEGSPALQLTASLVELLTGAVVFFANPWIPSDILACIMKALGGVMMIEAVVVAGFSDLYFHFWLKNLAALNRGWALVTLIGGGALTVAAMLRMG